MRPSLQPALRFTLWTVLSALLVIPCRAEKPTTIHPDGYVTDLAKVLSEDDRARLEDYCVLLHQRTGAQLAIVTVNSLEGMSSRAYAHELFNALGVGDKTRNDGVLILIAPKEHKYWTSVGRGLESVITNALAEDAGKEMTPYFRQGSFGAGIEIAARRLGGYIAENQGVQLEEFHAVPAPTRVQQPAKDNDEIWKIVIVVFAVALAVLLFVVLVRWMMANAGTSDSSYGQGGILSQPRGTSYTNWNNQTYYGGNYSTWGGFGGSSDNRPTFTSSDSGSIGSGWSSGGDSSFGGFDGGSSSSDSGGGGSW